VRSQRPPGTTTPTPDSHRAAGDAAGTLAAAAHPAEAVVVDAAAVGEPLVDRAAAAIEAVTDRAAAVEEEEHRALAAPARDEPPPPTKPSVRWAVPERPTAGGQPAAPAAEPTLRIGQIEVIVAAPEAARPARAARPASSSNASRSYLRSL
jgi:hypothetical protein